ncbi:Non-classical arabinogalactan protein [Thalictrum thalictroides]|uniref:Non-classical arabinogalactan protein n=1 Tax=Thalictrum thalictroides TaxID=46969 RepID=A0A7J6W900_THATH|nr:Non-classical arabinogalactan protein [Thalictrum thalictroides]
MAFVSVMSLVKVLLAIQLSLVLLMSCTVDSSKVVLPPTKSPVPSPRPTPARTPVAVQGVVYCKSCKYNAFETLMGAKPLSDAIVKLQCNNTKKPITVDGKTDKNGYFFIQAPKKVSTHGYHKCRVFLVSAPSSSGCTKRTNLNAGWKGAFLKYAKQPVSIPFTLFSVGPFAFAPTTCPK